MRHVGAEKRLEGVDVGLVVGGIKHTEGTPRDKCGGVQVGGVHVPVRVFEVSRISEFGVEALACFTFGARSQGEEDRFFVGDLVGSHAVTPYIYIGVRMPCHPGGGEGVGSCWVGEDVRTDDVNHHSEFAVAQQLAQHRPRR